MPHSDEIEQQIRAMLANGGTPPGEAPADAIQLAQPLNDLQFFTLVPLLLPAFDVVNPAWVEPSKRKSGYVSVDRHIPATLHHRIAKALEHIENTAYLIRLGELRGAAERGKARADQHLKEAAEKSDTAPKPSPLILAE